MLLGRNEGFPGGSVVKNPLANAGDTGLIPGSGRSPEEENGNPLQYSCLGNPMDRGAWQATVHRVATFRQDLAIKQLQKRRKDTSSILTGGNEREGHSCTSICRSGREKFCVLPSDDSSFFIVK